MLPCVGPVTTAAVRGSVSASVSLASTPGALTSRAVSTVVEYESLVATGAVAFAAELSKRPANVAINAAKRVLKAHVPPAALRSFRIKTGPLSVKAFGKDSG
jgi:hypothetical protein